MAASAVVMAISGLALSVADDECKLPSCVKVWQACNETKVSTCEWWPYHCSNILHGDAVECVNKHDCVCRDKFCADADKKCVPQPYTKCQLQVSTCDLWPHHCSMLIHGDGVYCDADYNCMCPPTSCAQGGRCVPTTNEPWIEDLLSTEANTTRLRHGAAFACMGGVAGMVVISFFAKRRGRFGSAEEPMLAA